MRTASVIWIAIAFASACSEVRSPVAPTRTDVTPPRADTPSEAALASVSPPPFPSVSRPARVYVAEKSPVYSMHGSPLASRYVLFDDGAFALQYASANYPFFQYLGTYKETDGVIVFSWEGCCGWGATGSLEGDSLTVEYTINMQMSDFLNGVYIRTK